MFQHRTSEITAVIKKLTVRSSMAVMVLLALTSPQNVLAQAAVEYESLPVLDKFKLPSLDGVEDMDRRAARDLRGKYSSAVNNLQKTQRQMADLAKGRQSGGSLAELEEFISGFEIPSMTTLDNESLSNLGIKRQKYFRNYLTSSPPGANRTRIINLTIAGAQQIAEGNFHPAARINAMLILGRLNVREGSRVGSTLPQPHPQVLAYLVQSLGQADLPDYLKITALGGIERHASIRRPGAPDAFPQAERRQIAELMLNNVMTVQANETISEDVVYWMQRRAIRILGLLGDPGQGGRYAQTLRDLMANADLKVTLRVDAVEAYGKLDFSIDESAMQAKQVATQIGEIVLAAAKSDATYIDEKIDEIRMTAWFLDETDIAQEGTSDDSGAGNSGLGRGVGADAPGSSASSKAKNQVPEILPDHQRELVRRRFKGIAWAGRVVLVGEQTRSHDGGFKQRLGPGEEADFIEELATNIDDMMKNTDVRKPDPDKEDDEEEESSDDENKEKLSLADQLKLALNQGAEAIQNTLSRFAAAPEDDASSGSGQ